MAKFKFVMWLLEFLVSREDLIFDWDEGNLTKSSDKHGIEIELIEACFDDPNLLALGEQYQPETDEARYGIIAKPYSGEALFVCFTIREGRIRPISARLANKKERSIYAEEIH